MPDSMDFVSMWSGAPGRYEITPEQKADSFTRMCISFWDTKQSTPYQGDAWFDSVVLTRADGKKYRFLLSICHG